MSSLADSETIVQISAGRCLRQLCVIRDNRLICELWLNSGFQVSGNTRLVRVWNTEKYRHHEVILHTCDSHITTSWNNIMNKKQWYNSRRLYKCTAQTTLIRNLEATKAANVDANANVVRLPGFWCHGLIPAQQQTQAINNSLHIQRMKAFFYGLHGLPI